MCLRIISHQIAGLPGGRVPTNILDEYSVVEPTRQASLDIFEGEWISHVPGFETGSLPLFTDPRISWLGEHAGGSPASGSWNSGLWSAVTHFSWRGLVRRTSRRLNPISAHS